MLVKIATLALLLLGILNPVSGNRIDQGTSILVFAIFALMTLFLKSFAKIAVILLILIFLINSWFISGDLRFFLTKDIPYNNDHGVLLATYKSVEKGQDYYESYKQAQVGRFSQSIVPGDIWGWRLPTIFYIWKILPGQALSIYFLYLILAAIVLYLAFQITRQFLPERLALLSPYLLFPYLHFAARDQMVLETEWWGILFFAVAIYLLIKKKLFLATLFLSLTLLIRELFILPVGLMLIYSLLKNRKLAIVFLIPMAAFLILFVYHVFRVNDYIDATGTLLIARTVPSGLYFLQQTLAFASWEYLAFTFRPFLIFSMAATAGCFYLYKKNKARESIILLLSFLPFPLAFLKFGTVPYNDYWGIVYVPMALILSPLLLLIVSRDNFLEK